MKRGLSSNLQTLVRDTVCVITDIHKCNENEEDVITTGNDILIHNMCTSQNVVLLNLMRTFPEKEGHTHSLQITACKYSFRYLYYKGLFV